MCLTHSLTAFTTAYLCAYGCSLIWLEIILSERRTEDNVSYYYIIISPSLCPLLCRRTPWMAITCGWRRAVLESSVISERTPACWRPQWVVYTLTTPVCVFVFLFFRKLILVQLYMTVTHLKMDKCWKRCPHIVVQTAFFTGDIGFSTYQSCVTWKCSKPTWHSVFSSSHLHEVK